MSVSAHAKKHNLKNDAVLEAVASLIQRQTAVYANVRREITLARMRGREVSAGHQDAWDIAWDCNTDACEIEDLYRKNGKSQVILKKIFDHPHATPNAIRAACNLLWRDHGKHARPELASAAYTQFKYIKDDQTWVRELARLGNIRAALEVEFDRMKQLMHDCGDLGDVLEEASRALGIKEPGSKRIAASDVVAAHRDTGAHVEIVIASTRRSHGGSI